MKVLVVDDDRDLIDVLRVILSRVEQLGSGQAMSVSVVIQSLRSVARCLAASSGSTEESE